MAARRYEISLRVLKNISQVIAHSKRNFASPRGHAINRGYYMPARGYEFHLRVFKCAQS